MIARLRRRTLVNAILIVSLVTVTCVGATALAQSAGKLVIAGWGGLAVRVAKEVFSDPFQSATGVQVEWIAAPGQQVAAMQAQAKAGKIQWDVLVLNPEQIEVLIQQGLVAKLPEELKAHMKKQLPLGISVYYDYGVPYASLADVMACNATLTKACPKTPQEFFDAQRFPGARSFYVGNALPAVVLALQADGVSRDKLFPIDIDRAFRKLEALKPHIKVFWRSGDESEQIFRNGEVVYAVLWSGRAFNLSKQSSDKLRLSVSWSGAVYEPGYVVAAAGAPNAQMAFKYIQWIADHPDAMAKFTQSTTYGFPTPAIFALLPADMARWVPEHSDHFSELVRLDYRWYVENKERLDGRWREFTSG